MAGFGESWGGLPWGGSSSDETESGEIYESVNVNESLSITQYLDVDYAVALSPVLVQVRFSVTLDGSYAPLEDPSNYSIPGLTVIRAVVVGPFRVHLLTSHQSPVAYTLTVAQARSLYGDSLRVHTTDFSGFSASASFRAAAQGERKVGVWFSEPMRQDSEFINPVNYLVNDLNGNIVATTLVEADGPTPISRAKVTLGASLVEGQYYSITVSDEVRTLGGVNVYPMTQVFYLPRKSSVLETRIRDYSGEVDSGLLGQPEGLVYFSPALDTALASSVIQVDDVSVCTRASDSYEFPGLLDPQPLYLWGPGYQNATLGASVLWATAERLGQAHINLIDHQADALAVGTTGPAEATLVEPIDITRAAFLNDSRWRLFGGLPTTFICAENLTPIGPGPTTTVVLEP
jgi:hypothetical protein